METLEPKFAALRDGSAEELMGVLLHDEDLSVVVGVLAALVARVAILRCADLETAQSLGRVVARQAGRTIESNWPHKARIEEGASRFAPCADPAVQEFC